MNAKILLKLCRYRQGSNEERVFLDIEGPGLNIPPLDITDKMGKSVVYSVPIIGPHSYGIRVVRGKNLPDQPYAKSPSFTISEPQTHLPIAQFVKDAFCTAIN